ncbi:MAG: hypothetical protein IKG39_07825 [Lachnospiraceae bacterium]|nr:hypothetical protein [Lachnospiraceae bacterium]
MSDFNNERNVHPACGQTQATAKAVCGINELLRGESRAHRSVGYKNSVSRYHMMTMSRCYETGEELANRTYRPQRGEKHEVFEPKYRLTVSSKYSDRVPQAAFVVNYFYPKVVPHLIKNNFACLKGRGVDAARNTLKEILRSADMEDYCVKADMKSYFASIDHETLYAELFPYMPDEWARWFFMTTVENTGRPVGLDLGSEVYQLAATSFLNKLDHMLDHGTYARYQDDLIFVGSKEECREALKTIRAEAARLKLRVSEEKTFMQPVKRPIKFLGFSFLKHETGRVTMKRLPEKIREERRKLRRMKRRGVPRERVDEHCISVRACLKKGSRSDLMALDRYINQLFKEEK